MIIFGTTQLYDLDPNAVSEDPNFDTQIVLFAGSVIPLLNRFLVDLNKALFRDPTSVYSSNGKATFISVDGDQGYFEFDVSVMHPEWNDKSSREVLLRVSWTGNEALRRALSCFSLVVSGTDWKAATPSMESRRGQDSEPIICWRLNTPQSLQQFVLLPTASLDSSLRG